MEPTLTERSTTRPAPPAPTPPSPRSRTLTDELLAHALDPDRRASELTEHALALLGDPTVTTSDLERLATNLPMGDPRVLASLLRHRSASTAAVFSAAWSAAADRNPRLTTCLSTLGGPAGRAALTVLTSSTPLSATQYRSALAPMLTLAPAPLAAAVEAHSVLAADVRDLLTPDRLDLIAALSVLL